MLMPIVEDNEEVEDEEEEEKKTIFSSLALRDTCHYVL